jgi:hypothetical protein
MACTVHVADERGRRLSYRIDWRSPAESRVRFDGAAGPGEWVHRLPVAGMSVLTRSAEEPNGVALDPALVPARAYLSPATLGERLAAPWWPARADGAAGTEVFLVGSRSDPPGLTVAVDTATHLPLRLDTADRDGRTQAAVCRWP